MQAAQSEVGIISGVEPYAMEGEAQSLVGNRKGEGIPRSNPAIG